ncbi:MAG: hypothetical protein Q8S84_04035 [bacterium]|nr:hypothetical protein [bacterium]MDP3380676.1 hypothetical protein [bacterium]
MILLSYYFCKWLIHAHDIFLPLGVLSKNHICNKYGSTTSSNVASSSQIAEAKVFNQTGHQLKFSYNVDKYFLSK